MIEPTIAAEIQERLSAIEAAHEVRILYACESGSRGWGFASPDSDTSLSALFIMTSTWPEAMPAPIWAASGYG